MDLSNQGFHVAEGREEPKAFSNAERFWMEERTRDRTNPFFSRKKKRLINFVSSLEIFPRNIPCPWIHSSEGEGKKV